MIEERIKVEGAKWAGTMGACCSLVSDGMSIDEKLVFDQRLDTLFGYASCEAESTQVLANSIHCFVLVGLGPHYVIPVGMFFVRSISGEEVYHFTIQVIRLVEKYGFRVVRKATDNHKTNQYMVKKKWEERGRWNIACHTHALLKGKTDRFF